MPQMSQSRPSGQSMQIKEYYSADQQGSNTKWIESSVTDGQKRDELPLYTISDKVNKPFLVELQVRDHVITFEVDTGVAVSIMSEDNFRYHFPSELISKLTRRINYL